jgi:hypothetical protein
MDRQAIPLGVDGLPTGLMPANLRASLDPFLRGLDELERSTREGIAAGVQRDLKPMFRKGWRERDLRVEGWGWSTHLTVKEKHSGRFMRAFHRLTWMIYLLPGIDPCLRKIEIADRDTKRIVEHFGMLGRKPDESVR